MSFASPVAAAIVRLLTGYNGRAFDPDANPLGLPRGGNRRNVINADGNFVALGRDAAIVGQAIADLADDTVAAFQSKLDEHAALLDRLKAATAAAANGPVITVNGMGGVVVLPDVPKVLPPIVTQPVAGSTPSLTGGALVLAVDRLTSLYGEAQKTIRFQISTAASFAANTIVYDSGVLAQAAVSASLANAQAALTGGTTYYVRAIQTDAQDVSSGWSAPVSFIFPRLPNAPVMSAPADGATSVGVQNQAITFTASAYSHPNGVTQAARRFEISKDNFATIVTVAGAIGQGSASLANPSASLTVSTLYKARCVDTDANGGVAIGASTSFTTATAFGSPVGGAQDGGRLGFHGLGDLDLFDIILAAKATETSARWSNGVTGDTYGSFDVLNGLDNTSRTVGANSIQGDCQLRTIGGDQGYLMAVDEFYAVASVLRPDVTQHPDFKVGGSEVFGDAYYWTSSETIAGASYAQNIQARNLARSYASRDLGYVARAAKRKKLVPPYERGTLLSGQGGCVAGYITVVASDGSVKTYMLIVPPASAHLNRVWNDTMHSFQGLEHRTDGKANTRRILAVATGSYNVPAAIYCDGFSYDGKDDFHLPAIEELKLLMRGQAALPSDFKFLTGQFYWSSTEVQNSNGQVYVTAINSSNGAVVGDTIANMNQGYIVCPVRRVEITI